MKKKFSILSIVLISGFINIANAQKQDSLSTFKQKKSKFGETMGEVFGTRPIVQKDLPRVVFIRSMILPGWGQITNKQYILLPFIYAGAIGGYYFGVRNNNLKYKNYRESLLKSIALSKGNVLLPNGVRLKSTEGYLDINEPNVFFGRNDLRQFYAKDEDGNYYTLNQNKQTSETGNVQFDAVLVSNVNDGNIIGPFGQTTFESTTANYRRYRDMSIVFMAVGWTIFAVQANVKAHLNNFDLSDDLSLNIAPATTEDLAFGAAGLTVKLNFK